MLVDMIKGREQTSYPFTTWYFLTIDILDNQ